MKHLYSIFIVLLLINSTTRSAQTATDQKILMQSLVDEIESAMNRGEEVNAKALAKQAYAEIPRYSQLSDAEKATALSEIDHVINPPKKESKREAALVEKERSILTTWLNNIHTIFDEKQALDLYERAKRDAAKFKDMSKEEINRILKQIEDQVKFLAPVAKSAKKPGQEEQNKEAQKNAGLRDEDAIRKAAANRAKLSPEQEELDMHLWQGLNSPGFGYGVSATERDLKAGANPNAIIHKNERIYSIADQVATNVLKAFDYKELIRILIKYGFDINNEVIATNIDHVPTGHRSTLLIQAIRNCLSGYSYKKLYDLINFLFELNADPNIPDSKGDTALHYLSTNIPQEFTTEQYRNLIKLFIDHGANINAENKIHRSPLTSAIVQRANYNFARALMEFDANPFVGSSIHEDTLSAIDAHIKHLKDLNMRPGLEGTTTAGIQKLEAFKKEFLQYIKNYREKHRKEIREATAQAMPVAQMPGVITEYLFGQEPKAEVEKE